MTKELFGVFLGKNNFFLITLCFETSYEDSKLVHIPWTHLQSKENEFVTVVHVDNARYMTFITIIFGCNPISPF